MVDEDLMLHTLLHELSHMSMNVRYRPSADTV